MNYPTTKQDAIAYESEKVKWGVPKYIGKEIVNYLNDLGAKHEMPDSPDGIVDYVNEFHKALVMRNEYFPKELPFDVIYPAFFSAVMNNFIETPDFQPWTVKNQLKAFKTWITKDGQVHKLYERYYHSYPEKRPKQLSGKATKMETWADQTIKDQYEKIKMIFEGKVPIPKVPGIDNYFERIEHEYRKRFKKFNYNK